MDRIKTGVAKRFGLEKRSYRLLYNIVSIISLAAVLSVHAVTHSVAMFNPGWFSYIFAFILMLGGLFIMAISIKKYFAEMSGLFKSTSQTLETGGMHRFVRHPLYLGTLIFALSLSLFLPEAKNFIALLVLLFYTRVGIYLEEKKLMDQFGELYSKYRDSVPMLIPRFQLFKK